MLIVEDLTTADSFQADADESSEHPSTLHVTMHHNWFAGTVQRHPRVVAGFVHVFNNVFQHWGLYGIGITCHAQVCFFPHYRHMIKDLISRLVFMGFSALT
eukprot:TRINITY_DN10591_c0_g1_i1.p1 TRINITY_DN10591_c0_g1~~TRINITY_DN10591_c0_g1_i1.p1  ORF type:complete len:101 (+),score=6.02 TRINITY_DN10591_c0_g1_i1:30-332(+)